jgi:hypothetical protein
LFVWARPVSGPDQAASTGVHHVGDDVLCVVELNTRKKVGVAGDIGDYEAGGFGSI